MKTLTALACMVLSFLSCSFVEAEEAEQKLVYREDFEKGAGEWEPFDPGQWRIEKKEQGQVYSQYVKKSAYKPPNRSPTNISLLKGHAVEEFTFTGRVKSTHTDYNHRDACVVFGYQDPAHFYYVHLGKATDDHANQIFIVNGEARKKISLTTTKGTPWTDAWHTVRVTRNVKEGTIAIYFDDLKQPAMTAKDDTFLWGRIGVGTFDDTADWDDIELRGTEHAGK